MKYYVIAGEASGDLHGSNLIKAIKARDHDAEIRFWGGDLMQGAVGHQPVKHIADLAFMGFIEVVANLRTILRNIRLCKDDIQSFNPDVLVLIDYPGFNLRMAEFGKKSGYKVAYYISPQLWAWKEGRVKKIKRFVDRMICILPFEVDFYKKHGITVDYVGHPLLDAIENKPLTALEGDAPIAIIPGSRKQEISKMLPVMIEAAKAFPNQRFEITAAPAIEEAFYQKFDLPDHVKIVYGKTHDVMLRSKAAMVTSGTATLETALHGTPEVVCYKGSAISYSIARRLVKVPYISLVNLIMDKELVKELIQGAFTPTQLKKELSRLLNPDTRDEMLEGYEELKTKLGSHGASGRAAQVITSL